MPGFAYLEALFAIADHVPEDQGSTEHCHQATAATAGSVIAAGITASMAMALASLPGAIR